MSEMSSSYEKFNYTVRPAKCIERKMLAEAFAKLSCFDNLKNYEYVGFGSVYFSDFALFHKHLGLIKMLSIEKDSRLDKRFYFNKPYSCIRILFGKAGEFLPSIEWVTKKILWLDYEGQLDKAVLSDIRTFCSMAASGSIIVVTVNASPEPIPHDCPAERNFRLDSLINRVGIGKVPSDIKEKDFGKWGKASICRRIITNEIQEILSERNGPLPDDEKIGYKQLFNFNYQDGQKMLSVGGIIYSQQDTSLFNSCKFDNLFFIRMGKEEYFIDVPLLTHREIRYLDKQLPKQGFRQLRLPSVKAEDIAKYERIYRYFPAFAETEI